MSGRIQQAIAAAAVSALLFGNAAAGSKNESDRTFENVEQSVVTQLRSGQPVNVMLRFVDSDVNAEIEGEKARKGAREEDAELIEKRIALNRKKWDGIQDDHQGRLGVIRSYNALPFAFVEIRSLSDLEMLAADPRVAYISLPRKYSLQSASLNDSLLAIKQPSVVNASTGFSGQGASVMVLDTGINKSASVFSDCGSTPGCELVSKNFETTSDGQDENIVAGKHGTLVSAILHKVAPGATIIVGDVVLGDSVQAYDPYIISAIDWAISNKAANNIVALNMSLAGATSGYDQNCDAASGINTNLLTAVNRAVQSSIVVVAAAGNNGSADLLPEPACYKNVISVTTGYHFTEPTSLERYNTVITGNGAVSHLRAFKCSTGSSTQGSSTRYDCYCNDASDPRQTSLQGQKIYGPQSSELRLACSSNAQAPVKNGFNQIIWRGMDLVAPGFEIDILNDGRFYYGTSFAAPYVSATAALLATTQQYKSKLSSDDYYSDTIRNRLKQSAQTFSVPYKAISDIWYTTAIGSEKQTTYQYDLKWLNLYNTFAGLTLPPPTVTLSATPSLIDQGQSSTLIWSSINATSCQGSWSTTALSPKGSKVVSSTIDKTYSISCTGSGGTVSASTKVTIGLTASIIPLLRLLLP